MFAKWILLILCIFFYTESTCARNTYAKLIKLVEFVRDHPNLKYGQWSVFAQNLHTGETILDINSNKSLSPASNLKLITSAVALSHLGSDYVYRTFLEYSGTMNHRGLLKGNIYITGQGDPTLGSNRFTNVLSLKQLIAEWVRVIKNKGIMEIDGHIIGDDSYFDYMSVPGQWSWEDMGNYYAPLTSGLCINENLYYLYFEPGLQVGQSAKVLRTDPEIPGLSFINNMKTGRKGSGDNGYIYGAPWQWQQQLEGTIPAGVKEFSIRGSLPDPANLAAEYLRILLEKRGIKISGRAGSIREFSKVKDKRYIIHTTTSPSLKEIIYYLNKKSINLYAEQLLKTVARIKYGSASFRKGTNVIKDWLRNKDINCNGIMLYDGSGLSRQTRVTTRLMVALLNVVLREPFYSDLYNSLPIAGDPNDIGTMRKRCKGTLAAFNLRAKTGQHDRVCANAGYVRTKSKQLIAFSMIANDYLGSYNSMIKQHEKVMIELAELH